MSTGAEHYAFVIQGEEKGRVVSSRRDERFQRVTEHLGCDLMVLCAGKMFCCTAVQAESLASGAPPLGPVTFMAL